MAAAGSEAGEGGAAGSGGDESGGEAGEGGEGGEPGTPLASRAGFIEIEPVSYVAPLESSPELESERARLFYAFVPADEAPEDKPVFVFFNGGPGASTAWLLTFGTGPFSLDAADLDAEPRPNPSSFTRLGNLLYIDSRLAGFSYGVADDPENEFERDLAFQKGSFNAAVDGADFARVVLRVLEGMPAVRDNPVVVVAESYGGTRAAVMLDLLVNSGTDGAPYVEASLAAEIDAHFAAVFPDVDPSALTPALRARQFGWQVLIQPLILGSLQYEAQSAVYLDRLLALAARLGTTAEELSNRCAYDMSHAWEWCEELDAAVYRSVTSPATFEQIVGVAPERVPGLPATDRTRAFHFGLDFDIGTYSDPEPLVERLGELPGHDQYFQLIISNRIISGFERAFSTPIYAGSFLRAARHVNTMITNADLDRVIASESIVPSLNAVVPLLVEPWFAGADYVDPDALPPTRFILHYAEHDDLGPAADRTVYFPSYPDSGHSVSIHQPDKLVADVAAFLAQTGLGE